MRYKMAVACLSVVVLGSSFVFADTMGQKDASMVTSKKVATSSYKNKKKACCCKKSNKSCDSVSKNIQK